MGLRTLEPDSAWDADEHAEAVAVLAGLDAGFTFKIWGDDGCGDCQRWLPAFGAALEAAEFPDEHVEQYEVERLPEGRKRGPLVEEYGIGLIPTVVVERDGEEVARFEEEEDGQPIAEYLADAIRELETTA